MILFPVKVESSFIKWPITNIAIIVITTLFYFFYTIIGVPDNIIEAMILKDWNLFGMLGSLFLHADFFHLLGNMIFLWVFGNIINATIGNGFYPVSYLFLGICASIMHLVFNGEPAIGASGAVNGIVGMTLMLFPVNRLRCVYSIMFFFWGSFTVKSFWMILLWLTFDILGVITGGGGIAYWAHIGGFLSGMLISFILLKFNLITTYDRTLIDIITGNTLEEEPSYKVNNQLNYMPEGRLNDISNDMANFHSIQEYELREKIQLMEMQRKDEELKQIITIPAAEEEKVIIEPVESKEINLNIRLLRAIRKDNLVTCFFVNEGDTVSNVEIEASDALAAEIYPKEIIKSRDTGSIKFTGTDPETNLKFRLYFSDGTEQVLYKDLIFSETEKAINLINPDSQV